MVDDQHTDESGVSAFAPLLGLREFPPPSSTVQVTFGARSRRSDSQAENRDHYSIVRLGRHLDTLLTSLPEGALPARFDEYGYAMVVADGLSSGGGEAASRLAVTALLELVLHFGKWNLRVDEPIAHEIMERAHRFYRHVDSAVVHQGLVGPASAAQTTLTAVFGAGRDLFFAHVGHSRAYLCRHGTLMRLTRDHTIGAGRETRVDLAPLVDVNETAHDLRHVLTNAIGMSGPVGPSIDLERFQLDDDDRVLVCTNGVTDAIDEDTIKSVLESARVPDEQCRLLVESDMVSRGADNATALVAHFRIPKQVTDAGDASPI